MEHNLNFSGNVRQPQLFRKQKTTSILGHGRKPQMEDYHNLSGNGRQLKLLEKGKQPKLSIGGLY